MSFSGLTAGLSAGIVGSFSVEPAPGVTTWTLANVDAPDPVNAGANITYTIQANVTAGGDAISVVATITLDAALIFVSNSGTNWTFSRVGQVITARIALVPSGLSPAITVVATAPSGSSTTVTTTASIIAANAAVANANATTNVTGVISGVDRDAASGLYFPNGSSQYTTYLAAVPASPTITVNPVNLWLLQGSGNAADSIGSCTLTNTFGTTGGALTGVTRVGYSDTDGGTNKKLVGTTGAPNPRTTSTLLGTLVDTRGQPVGQRDLMGVQTGAIINLGSNGKLIIVAGASTSSVNTYVNYVGMIWMRTNITNSTITLFTRLEKLVGTFLLPSNGSAIWFGGHTAACSNARHGYGVEFSGAGAELTDNQIRTEMQTRGETVLW